MPFNGTGTFTRLYNWLTDELNSIPITASRFDDEDDDFASGLSNCLTKDGQTQPTANLPMNSKKFTNLTNGSARTDSIALGQVQDGTYTYLGTAGGSADAYTASPTPSITVYNISQRYLIKIPATNLTTTPYIQISGIASPASTAIVKKLNASKAEIALEASDMIANGIYEIQRNSANDAWILLNPEKPFFDARNLTNSSESVKGVAGIATQTEVNAITDDLRFITPLKLGNGYSFLNSSSGSLKLPSWLGGFLIQWGLTGNIGSSGSNAIAFPTPYPNAVRNIQVTPASLTSGPQAANYVDTISTTGFTLYNQGGITSVFYWFSIGY